MPFAALAPEVRAMKFMDARPVAVLGASCMMSRSGYTGEDGFEISVPVEHAERLARALLAEPEVQAIGLGAAPLSRGRREGLVGEPDYPATPGTRRRGERRREVI